MSNKKNLEDQVILDGREYGINTVLFRHAVGSALGVNATDMECLGVLFFKGLSTPKELAEYTGLSSGATTAMLDRLENAGLIHRKPNPADRRGTHITVADEAKTKVGPMFTSVRNEQHQLVSSYSVEQLEIIADYLKRSSDMWSNERRKLRENLKQG
jgi:DNA-binding MarR family transcriptional regulator